MNEKPITLEEYKEVAEEFFPKYHFVAQELGEGCKTEDVLKVMESLAGLVLKKRSENKKVPLGFNKDGALQVDSPQQCPAGTVAMKDDNGVWGCYDF